MKFQFSFSFSSYILNKCTHTHLHFPFCIRWRTAVPNRLNWAELAISNIGYHHHHHGKICIVAICKCITKCTSHSYIHPLFFALCVAWPVFFFICSFISPSEFVATSICNIFVCAACTFCQRSIEMSIIFESIHHCIKANNYQHHDDVQHISGYHSVKFVNFIFTLNIRISVDISDL